MDRLNNMPFYFLGAFHEKRGRIEKFSALNDALVHVRTICLRSLFGCFVDAFQKFTIQGFTSYISAVNDFQT